MDRLHETVSRIIREAGKLMLSFRQPQVYDKGRHADFVTEADLAVQAFLIGQLSAAFPEAAFFAEEKKDNVLDDRLTFIIDPIDGTTNFFRGRCCSAISVGAVLNRTPVYGAIFNPYEDKLYHATAGQGAFCDGERLQVADNPLSRSIVGLGTAPYVEELRDVTVRSFALLLERCLDTRRLASSCVELCDVAAGRCDAMLEWQLSPWDYAAGALIVREAGGMCGCITGGAETYDRPCAFVAASKACFNELQQMLLQAAKEAGLPLS